MSDIRRRKGIAEGKDVEETGVRLVDGNRNIDGRVGRECAADLVRKLGVKLFEFRICRSNICFNGVSNLTFLFQILETRAAGHVPHGLGVRISDFHSDGPGSIPGVGGSFFHLLCEIISNRFSYFII
jgi:hypothetical protein